MSKRRVLLLNSTYEILNFISEKRLFKMLFAGKVDIISHWKDKVKFIDKEIYVPSIVRMRYYVSRNFNNKLNFSRSVVFRRDNYTCCYCGIKFKPNQITLDHIVPKSFGGKNSFLNCITACFPCNSRKGNKTPEQASMKLLYQPYEPKPQLYIYPDKEVWHEDWEIFFK